MRWYELIPTLLTESARIQHAEDLIFWEGSAGAVKALESLKAIESGQHQDVTVKWDGSPAVIFGRNQAGDFVLTDKSGFSAKGYNGKSTSGGDLQQMILNRKLSKGQEVPDSYSQFAGKMRSIFKVFESAVPKDHIGYFKGDLLYYSTPPTKGKSIIFTPNVVTYTVNKDSDIGAKIQASKAGVVIHNEVTVDEVDTNLNIDVDSFFIGNDLLVMPPISMNKSADINNELVRKTQEVITANKSQLDKLLNPSDLANKKLTDLPSIFYTYTNSKVDKGMTGIGNDFFDWLATSKVSTVKQKRIAEHVQSMQAGFSALWQVFAQIQALKDSIIDQFDNHDAPVKASIGNDQGGEGYVMKRPWGAFKLVNRAGFTAANRAIER